MREKREREKKGESPIHKTPKMIRKLRKSVKSKAPIVRVPPLSTKFLSSAYVRELEAIDLSKLNSSLPSPFRQEVDWNAKNAFLTCLPPPPKVPYDGE